MAVATATKPSVQEAGPPQIVKAAVVACFDPRIQGLLDRYRRDYGLNGGNSTPHHPPGGSLNIQEELVRLDLAVKLGANEIHLLDHRDPTCYAYKLHYGDDYDTDLHERNMRQARELLNRRYPGVNVRIALIELSGSRIIELR